MKGERLGGEDWAGFSPLPDSHFSLRGLKRAWWWVSYAGMQAGSQESETSWAGCLAAAGEAAAGAQSSDSFWDHQGQGQ